MKKKRSKSGGEKNESGDRRKEQFEDDEITLCFFGAGGHVEISGILNFSPFGVEQQPPLTSSMTSSTSSSFLFLFSLFCCFFKFLLFFVFGFVGSDVVIVLPEGAMREKQALV
ncbi:hypothetical protein S83_034476 [Arachis hypogaea]|nr:uncharacterized protein DS421_11g322430 [Arachis hypogaea]